MSETCKVEMFQSFKDLDGYIPNNRPKPAPEPPEANRTVSLSQSWPLLNAKEEIIGAEWNYGDAFDIPVEIRGNIIDDDGNLLDLEEYLTGKSITVEILDHFFNLYKTFTLNCEVETTSEAVILLLEFTEEVSKEIPRGTYHLRLFVDDYLIHSEVDQVLNAR